MRKPIFNIKPNSTPDPTPRTKEQQAEVDKWMERMKAMQKSPRRDLRSAPLRFVVDKDVWAELGKTEDGITVRAQRWRLECGHMVLPPQDFYGARNPNKMRCGECAKEPAS